MLSGLKRKGSQSERAGNPKGGKKMLVIIIDLHFVDGTAGEHNVPVDAFHIFFENLKSAAERLKKKKREVK
jgi:hypothetical protein